MKVNCLIVDDEPFAHTVIEEFSRSLPLLHLLDGCFHALEAIEVIHTQCVDILFLDIDMPKVSGLELVRTLPVKPQIILTTAHSEYALEGFELDVCDYLLKPFSFERFLKAVNRALSRLPLASPVEESPATDHLLLKADKQTHRIYFSEIYYVESYGSYVKVHLKDRLIVSLDSLKNLEAMLPPQAFVRIHKSYLIALDKVATIAANYVVINRVKLPVGAVYKMNLAKMK